MNRLLFSFMTLAFAASLGGVSLAAPTAAPMKSSSSMSSSKSSTSCPKGQSYVKPYTKTSGTKVAGYCRKSSSSSMSSMSSSKSSTTKPAPAATKM